MYLYTVSTFFGFTILLDSNVNNIIFSKLSILIVDISIRYYLILKTSLKAPIGFILS